MGNGAPGSRQLILGGTADIRTRDRQDSKRNYGATHGDDAVILDTTDMTMAQQVDQIVEWARKKSA